MFKKGQLTRILPISYYPRWILTQTEEVTIKGSCSTIELVGRAGRLLPQREAVSNKILKHRRTQSK